MNEKKIMSAREIATYPPLPDEIAGNYDIVRCFRAQLELPLGKQSSLTILGEPGTGKTGMAIGFFRALSGKPIGREEDVPFFGKYSSTGQNWGFVRIDGVRDDQKVVANKINTVNYACGDVALVLIDELDELIRQKNAGPLRLLDHENVLVISTARSFQLASDSDSFFNRTTFLRTQRPDESDLMRWIAHRVADWSIEIEDVETIRLLARKSQRIVGRVVQCLSHAASSWERKLTRDRLHEYLFDPIQVTVLKS